MIRDHFKHIYITEDWPTAQSLRNIADFLEELRSVSKPLLDLLQGSFLKESSKKVAKTGMQRRRTTKIHIYQNKMINNRWQLPCKKCGNAPAKDVK